MSSYRIEFDPDGYQYATEPGVDWIIDGDQLGSRQGKTKTGATAPFIRPRDNFLIIPGTKWLIPKPLQFDGTWNRSVLLEDYVATKSKWDFCTGINPATQIITNNPLDQPGTAGPDGGDFMLLTVPASPGAEPISVNELAIFTAAGIEAEIPAGMKVIAATKSTIAGGKTPMIQFRQYPAPEDVILYGFGNVAVLLVGKICYVLKVTGGISAGTWELVGGFDIDKVIATGKFSNQVGVAVSTPGGAAPILDIGIMRGISAIPVGFDDIWLTGGAGGQIVNLRKSVGGPPANATSLASGRWWWSGFPGQRFHLQWQAIGYHVGRHGETDDVETTAAMMDLGVGYAPTATSTPIVRPSALTYKDPDNPADLVATTLTAGYKVESTKFGDVIEVQLIDLGNAAFVPDGLKYQAGIRLKMVPGDDVDAASDANSFGNANCLAPQVKSVIVQFPVVLVDRQRPDGAPFILTADKFASVKVSTSLREPTAKTVKVLLWEDGVRQMETWGLDRRCDFPFHVVESASGNFGDAVVRVMGWVREVNYTEYTFAGVNAKDETKPVRSYEFEACGLIGRMTESPWRYFGRIVGPVTTGELNWQDGAKRVVKQSGIDPTDTDFFFAETDTSLPNLQILPGAPVTDTGTAGTRVDSPYGPKDDEDPASWVSRISLVWRGWLFHDSVGQQMRLTRDKREDLTPTADATLYASHAAALAHSADRHQTWGAMSRLRFRRVASNCVSVGGKGLDGELLPVLIDEDHDSIGTVTAANFTGEPVRPVRVDSDLCVDRQSQGIVARRYLLRLARVDTSRDWETYRAPWEVGGSGVDVGSIISLQYRGKWLVVNLEAAMLSAQQGIWLTTFTGEYLPNG